LNTATGSIRYLFPEETASLHSGRFSPDGKHLCFHLSAADPDGPIQKLFICDFTLVSESSGTAVKGAGDVPGSFTLTGNYPNPFNMSTTIRFSIPDAGFVRLSIYNTIGQKVRELTAQEMAPGTHAVVWDGKDGRGMKVSTGTYISHLQWGNHTTTGRMALIK
jgi:hypothetical protein